MKIKCYEITPHPSTKFDSLVLIAGKTWKPILETIEDVLESSYLQQDDPDGQDWTQIKVQIKCVWYEEDELYEMGYSTDAVNAEIGGREANRPFAEPDCSTSVPSWVSEEIKATWRTARDAGGEMQAFRIIERMVDRLGYGRRENNPSLASNATAHREFGEADGCRKIQEKS